MITGAYERIFRTDDPKTLYEAVKDRIIENIKLGMSLDHALILELLDDDTTKKLLNDTAFLRRVEYEKVMLERDLLINVHASNEVAVAKGDAKIAIKMLETLYPERYRASTKLALSQNGGLGNSSEIHGGKPLLVNFVEADVVDEREGFAEEVDEREGFAEEVDEREGFAEEEEEVDEEEREENGGTTDGRESDDISNDNRSVDGWYADQLVERSGAENGTASVDNGDDC